MLKPLKKFYNDQQLHPTFWGIFLNPFYFARKGLWQGIKQLSQKVGGRILDIGCGQKPYKNLFNYKEGSFPITENFTKHILSIPIFPGITNDQIKLICEKINEVLK